MHNRNRKKHEVTTLWFSLNCTYLQSSRKRASDWTELRPIRANETFHTNKTKRSAQKQNVAFEKRTRRLKNSWVKHRLILFLSSTFGSFNSSFKKLESGFYTKNIPRCGSCSGTRPGSGTGSGPSPGPEKVRVQAVGAEPGPWGRGQSLLQLLLVTGPAAQTAAILSRGLLLLLSW